MDKGLEALEKFYKEFTERNPRDVSLLLRIATESYIENTERSGKPKSDDAGTKVYDAMYNCVRNDIHSGMKPSDEREEELVDEVVKQEIGIEKASLEALIKRGIDLLGFQETIKPSIANLNKRLDAYSARCLKEEHMTDAAKKYLVGRAKKLEIKGIEGITADDIKSIDDFRFIASKIAEYKRS